MEKILISACLLGENCTYEGKNNKQDWIDKLLEKYELVPFCPEVEGGLPIPRIPSERRKSFVVNKEGKDVTNNYSLGALKALNICKYCNIKMAILKENSPSCGVHSIHDGTFRGKLKDGKGFTTELLENNGIKVISELEVPNLLLNIKRNAELKEEGRLRNIAKEKEKLEEPKKTFSKERKFDKPRRKDFKDKKSPRKFEKRTSTKKRVFTRSKKY